MLGKAFFMIKVALLLRLTDSLPLDPNSKCPADGDEKWSYNAKGTNGPDYWGEAFPACYGQSQSPVEIVSQNVEVDPTLQKLTMLDYDTPVIKASVENNGYTVKVTPQDGTSRTIEVENTTYSLLQMHFHWGDSYSKGSEHKVDGTHFVMEVHLVHGDEKGKIAVVGFFLQRQEIAVESLSPITELLTGINYKGDVANLKSNLDLSKLVPENPASFYRYQGSLTTPGCNEGVVWTLLKKKGYLGAMQHAQFEKLYSKSQQESKAGCRITNNFRPLQPLNGRKITVSP